LRQPLDVRRIVGAVAHLVPERDEPLDDEVEIRGGRKPHVSGRSGRREHGLEPVDPLLEADRQRDGVPLAPGAGKRVDLRHRCDHTGNLGIARARKRLYRESIRRAQKDQVVRRRAQGGTHGRAARVAGDPASQLGIDLRARARRREDAVGEVVPRLVRREEEGGAFEEGGRLGDVLDPHRGDGRPYMVLRSSAAVSTRRG